MTATKTKQSTTKSILANCFFIFILTTCESFIKQTHGSGVFEFELVNLQRLDYSQRASSGHHHHHSLADLRLLICLKEAFASQLDGPCAFGNVSLTLNQQQAALVDAATNSEQQQQQQQQQRRRQTNGTVVTTSIEAEQQQQQQRQNQYQSAQELDNKTGNSHYQQQQQGSHMTNVVRIPFTFRWTKSFTIILTAEQLTAAGQQAEPDSQQQQIPSTRQQQSNSFAQPELSTRTQTGTKSLQPQQNQQQQQITTTNQTALLEQPQQQQQLLSPSPSSLSTAASTPLIIDRHVLTENEVLPNLETNPNKFWTSRFSRGSKSSLVYRFRVYCALNYYGDGCSTFCRPRDDQFGHYNCSSTGQKICLEGWHGQDCDRARCRSGCNQQHGFCDRPDTCQCRPGWTGSRCDECIPYPGCQNGYCLSPWQCVCHKSWGGVLCDQDLNYCGTHYPCQNNATCQNVAPARYKCHCPEGYTGANCEIKLATMIDLTSSMTQLSAGCILNPCLNGGTCYGFNNQLQPTLGRETPSRIEPELATPQQALQTGPADSDDNQTRLVTADSRIESHTTDEGTITTTTITTLVLPVYRCQCPPGWTGDYCQWAEPVSMLAEMLSGQNNSFTTMASNLSAVPSSTDSSSSPTGGAMNDELALRKPSNHEQDLNRHLNEPTVITTTTTTTTTTTLDGDFLHSMPPTASTHLEMRHLISGVVVASAVGVFLTSLLLAWCCLLAIEKGRFHFIQMNVVRGDAGDCGSSGSSGMSGMSGSGSGGVSSTLRRVHEKIRDSFRRSPLRGRIKPDTKLSIENILRPPPSYEESNYTTTLNKMGIAIDLDHHADQLDDCHYMTTTATRGHYGKRSVGVKAATSNVNLTNYVDNLQPSDGDSQAEILVKRGALGQEIALKKSAQNHQGAIDHHVAITSAQMSCPKHGHLYRSNHNHKTIATTIEIEYQPTTATITSHNTKHNPQLSSDQYVDR